MEDNNIVRNMGIEEEMMDTFDLFIIDSSISFMDMISNTLSNSYSSIMVSSIKFNSM